MLAMLCPSYCTPTENSYAPGEARGKFLGLLFQGLVSGTHLCLLQQYLHCLCPVLRSSPPSIASLLSVTYLRPP